MGECVRQYLETLPNIYRTVILLHDIEGLTNPEIASRIDISLHTVKIRIHRARKKLRELLVDVCEFHIDDRGVLVCEPKQG